MTECEWTQDRTGSIETTCGVTFEKDDGLPNCSNCGRPISFEREEFERVTDDDHDDE